jgi:hypothetical protein
MTSIVDMLRMMAIVLGGSAFLFGFGAVCMSISRFELTAQVWCSVHNAYEDGKPSFRWCLECGHNFKTEQELLDARNTKRMASIEWMNKRMPDLYSKDYVYEPITDSTKINSCPYCLHDW